MKNRARSQTLNPGLPRVWHGPNCCICYLLPPRNTLAGGRNWKWSQAPNIGTLILNVGILTDAIITRQNVYSILGNHLHSSLNFVFQIWCWKWTDILWCLILCLSRFFGNKRLQKTLAKLSQDSVSTWYHIQRNKHLAEKYLCMGTHWGNWKVRGSY